MSEITPEKRRELLAAWKARHDEIEAVDRDLQRLAGMSPDTPLGKAMWNTFGLYTDALAHQLGDSDNWLNWYWLDNEMGKKAMAAKGSRGRRRKIRTTDDLAQLIEASM